MKNMWRGGAAVGWARDSGGTLYTFNSATVQSLSALPQHHGPKHFNVKQSISPPVYYRAISWKWHAMYKRQQTTQALWVGTKGQDSQRTTKRSTKRQEIKSITDQLRKLKFLSWCAKQLPRFRGGWLRTNLAQMNVVLFRQLSASSLKPRFPTSVPDMPWELMRCRNYTPPDPHFNCFIDNIDEDISGIWVRYSSTRWHNNILVFEFNMPGEFVGKMW